MLVERRTLSKNLTLSYNKVIYQIKTKRAAYTMRGAQVEVRENSWGEILIEYQGRALDYSIHRKQERQLDVTPPKLIDAALVDRKHHRKREVYHPPADHPWRRFEFTENSLQAKERRGELCMLHK